MKNTISWRALLQAYFLSGYNYLILAVGTLVVFLFDYCIQLSTLEYKKFLFYDFFCPLIIYFLLLINCYLTIHPKSSFVKSVTKMFETMMALWWLIILKIMWNFCNYCIMGFHYMPDPELGFVSIFLLMISWFVILFIAGYVIPKIVNLPKNQYKISLSDMISYWFSTYKIIFKALIYSFFTVVIFLFLITFLLSYFHPIFCFFCSSELLKIFVEKFLSSLMYVLYSQLVMIFFCYIYKFYLNSTTKKRIKILQ